MTMLLDLVNSALVYFFDFIKIFLGSMIYITLVFFAILLFIMFMRYFRATIDGGMN